MTPDSAHVSRSGPAPLVCEIFISYSRKDNQPVKPGDSKGWVTALRDEILEDHRRFSTEPLRIFLDTDEIHSMDDWRRRILEKGLRHSRILLVCLSPNYFSSKYCKMEWEEYTRRQVHSLMDHESITPVYFVNVPGSDEQANAEQMDKWMAEVMRANFTDFRPWFQHGAEALREEALKAEIQKLGLSLWQRIERARRAASAPGNVRRVNPHFVGRNSELLELQNKLSSGSIGVVTAVHGLGGQGKTELAIAYAHGWADLYPGGLWLLGAENRKEILPLIGELTSDLGIPASADTKETEEQRGKRVLAELKRRSLAVRDHNPERASCLLLLDNVSEAVLLSEPQLAMLPREPWLQVLATTRLGEDVLTASQEKSLAFVAVDALQEDDALALLRDHQKTKSWASPADETAARDIVRELGGFTLAIESVAIYLGLTEVRPAAYLNKLKRDGLPTVDALGMASNVATQMQHREKQLALVLDATLEQLASGKIGDAVRSALDYAALLPPDCIPLHWLRSLMESEHPGIFDHEEGSPDPWLSLRRRLEGLRLLTPADRPEIVRMHRLVAAHLRERMGKENKNRLTPALYNLLDSVAEVLEKTAEHESAHLWMLFPLQEALLYLDSAWPNKALGYSANVAGNLELTLGRLDRAETLLRMAERHRKALYELEPESQDASRNLSWTHTYLGDFYLTRGNKGDAEEAFDCFRKALETRERLLEANPESARAARDVSVSLERLGDFYLQSGKPGDAEEAFECFRKTLETCERLLEANPDSAQAARDVSVSLERLGDFYLQSGKPGDAEEAFECFRKTLETCERLLEANPDSAQAARDV
ncbi:MAG: TIR domain-containing protein, partial [Syntrophobacteraceae bacterium]